MKKQRDRFSSVKIIGGVPHKQMALPCEKKTCSHYDKCLHAKKHEFGKWCGETAYCPACKEISEKISVVGGIDAHK
jgi:hypothetical protein